MTDHFRTGQARKGQFRTGKVRTSQVKTGPLWTGQVRLDQVRTGKVRFSQLSTGTNIFSKVGCDQVDNKTIAYVYLKSSWKKRKTLTWDSSVALLSPTCITHFFATLGPTWEFQLCLKSCNLASWTTKWHYYVGVSHPPTTPDNSKGLYTTLKGVCKVFGRLYKVSGRPLKCV